MGIMTTLSAPVAPDDTQLVARSLDGDTDAFGRIVERYQTLVCSLAYSACGNVHLSEDIAQETFIAAWRQLRTLREPVKLKGWLCGIARNVVNNSLRRLQRTPTARAEAWDDSLAVSTAAGSPCDHVISQQEEAIVWRALRELPENYREPLVLYYRHGESAAAVANALDLSQDAVMQRLSRGRAMLAEQVSKLVQTALRHSGPTQAFTLGVLAALPMLTTSASAATIGATAAKGSVTVKAAAWVALANAVLGPVLMFVALFFGYRLDRDEASSPQRRTFVTRFYRLLAACMAVFCLAVVSLTLTGWPRSHPARFAGWLIGLGAGYVVVAMVLSVWVRRQHRRLAVEAPRPQLTSLFEYRSNLLLLGLPLVHIRLRGGIERGPVKAWIAGGDSAIGVIFAFGAMAVAPISFGGFSIGLLTLGGLAVGLMSFGGVSFGPWAIGGFAVGWQAFGGCAIGWSAALGGVAVAHDLAQGGVALARHANDAVAEAFFKNSGFFQKTSVMMRYACWLNLFFLLPLVLWQWSRKQQRRVTKQTNWTG